jgi:type IV pilus assembly protein PilC
MSSYQYKAIDADGRVVRGVLPAVAEGEIERELERRGLFLIESRPRPAPLRSRLFARQTVAPRMLIEFYHRFAQTIEIGYPIVAGLEEIARYMPSAALRRIIGEIRFAIEGGASLVEAMGRHPRVFQPLDAAMVGMGERAGILPDTLKDLAAFHEWRVELRSLLVRTLLYPAVVCAAIVAVIGVWVGYVLPQMAEVLRELGSPLPLATELILEASRLARDQGGWLLGLLLALVLAGVLRHRSPAGRILLHRRLLKLPLFGRILNHIALARLGRHFAAMLGAGMNINAVFQLLADRILGNRYLEACLREAHRNIQSGEPIAESFERTGGFPPLLIGAIRHGEKTGTLEEAFRRMGAAYDREVKRAVDTLTKSIEPVAILALGGVFGIIALSILLPLYDVMGGLGKAY